MTSIAGISTPVQHIFHQELERVRKEARERTVAAVRRKKTSIVRLKANTLKEKVTGENGKDNEIKLEQENENCNLIKAEQTEDDNNPFATATSNDSISPITQVQNAIQQALITSSSQLFTTEGSVSPIKVDDTQKYKGLKSAGKRKRNKGVGANWETANLPTSVTKPKISSTPRTSININRGHLAALQYTTVLIKRAREAVKAKANMNVAIMNVRKRLNDMELWDFVDEHLVARSKVFDQAGLYGVSFDLDFPWDIRRDAERLLSKWDSKDFNTDLMRGVETRTGTNKRRLEFKIRSLEKNSPIVKANYHGQGNLYNGQWWPLQICTIRDGAHGCLEGGIYGKPGAGAFSIVLSSGGYKDIDNGNVIKYCGTAGKEGEVSAGTKRLMESHQLENEIRVLRNSAMSAIHSAYRPEKGIRFDGMYTITSIELLDPETMMHRFTMERCPNQDPIRHQGLEKRPTEQQLAKLEELQIRFCG
ncbi:MAG: hypothetical protein Q9167_001312 [Letrouitia subvulpina]